MSVLNTINTDMNHNHSQCWEKEQLKGRCAVNEAKLKRFGQNDAKHLIWICFFTPATKTSSEVLSMLERTFWFGAVLLFRGRKPLERLRQQQI